MNPSFLPEHTVRSHALTVDLPLEEAFRYFTPEGERAWAKGWDPVYLHPADGTPQPGMVFTTGEGEEATLWTMTRYEPAQGLVEYQRVTPGSRTGSVMVQCTALGDRRTRATVMYTMTALSERGNATLREMDEARYRAFIGSWEEAIARAVAG